ncbi:MAG: hypothetical protein IPK18_04575 [Sphingobacteriales bacterium]|nr:MAG: hypothetical protein IPK18_04575 [Sphingobacteriales bacterium]
MLQILSTNWHAMRIIRLVLAIIIIVEGIRTNDKLLPIMGFVFLLMAIFNVGCCNTNCSTKNNNSTINNDDTIIYEEIK